MRHAIDRNPKRLKDILNDSGMRAEFLGGAKNSEKAVEAFVKENAGNALKTRPKVSLSDSYLHSNCSQISSGTKLRTRAVGIGVAACFSIGEVDPGSCAGMRYA